MVRFCRHAVVFLMVLAVVAVGVARAADTVVIDIGSRRELFVDARLIDSLRDGARRVLHHPRPQNIAIVHDAPWEGAGSGYHSVFHDGERYRMYYRGSKLGVEGKRLIAGAEVYCYAESKDGVEFRKPELGLFEHDGSKRNNIVWRGVGSHNLAPFLDTRPDCPAASRYKALGGIASQGGLFAFHSPDGVHWSRMREKPVVTRGAFDSQNLAFWDSEARVYRAYFRTFTKGVTTADVWKPAGYRAIRTATSKDFLRWENEADLTYEDSPIEHLYTNQIAPYFRAPHLLIGFPTRYVERGWSSSMRALPDLPRRKQRAAAHLRYGTALTEGLLMASRDGVHFERWNEAFLRPGPERPDSWLYGHQYIAWHAVETRSSLPGAANEMSIYASEGSWHGKGNSLRRYTMRLDGFVSVSAPRSIDERSPELRTRPLKFAGNQLDINMATSASGGVRVEIQDAEGMPLPGFALKDCDAVFGDALSRTVTWNKSSDVSKLAGRVVRLRFTLDDADLYAFQFHDGAP